ncbi:hypothetical protein M3Y97_00020600 [Aphelenchoides bicaudatus]|nr:hypothetical protein M3Y97_00020600 [Aphelenchoides bicaudatus]
MRSSQATSRDDSIDIHELNAQTDTSSSSDETIVQIPRQQNGTTKSGTKTSESTERVKSESGGEDELDIGLNKARSHWIQLYKVNVQNQIVQQMFINMLRDHPQTRPIWQFSRKLDIGDIDWPVELAKNIQFRHHCSSIQAALTMVMDNMDDKQGMAKLLMEIGTHHFFYDAYEPHFELMHEGFMQAMRQLLENSNEYPDSTLCRSWNHLWDIVKTNIGRGIANQRRIYLLQCVTPTEMQQVRSIWKQVKQFGIEKCGNIVTGTALKTYNEQIIRYKINLSVNIDEHGEIFSKFAFEVIKALETTIDFYTTDCGFTELPHVLKNFVHNCIVLDVCPSLVRRAFMQGLTTMLIDVLGHLNEDTVHLWNKIYRVLEQAS